MPTLSSVRKQPTTSNNCNRDQGRAGENPRLTPHSAPSTLNNLIDTRCFEGRLLQVCLFDLSLRRLPYSDTPGLIHLSQVGHHPLPRPAGGAIAFYQGPIPMPLVLLFP